MSNEILFRTQLASIMEVLANAAVEEICKLVDDGYAVVHLQMSEYQKENEALKVALHLMELKAARGCAERARAPENHLDPYSDGALTLRDKPRGTSKEGPTVAGNRVLGNPGDVCPQGFVEEGNPVTTFSLKQVEPAGADNDRNTCILIKEEIPEGSSNAHADMKIPVQGALDSGAGEEDGVPALGLGVSAAECPQEHRRGAGPPFGSLPLVWPPAGNRHGDLRRGRRAAWTASPPARDFGASGGFAAGCNGSAKEKRFVCRFCGKGFTRLNALEIHQRVHTGEKPFRCAQCGKRFSDSSNHRRHQSVHTRERPFSCTQCERSFSHHYQLKVHQRVHTGDRPFCCVHCGKKFGERSFLKMHQQRDHAPLYVT
ncbi:hypothetical protein ANANG_G00112150 [Anguilla anguilla]|uniref:C2H2-type domain-containing protein n=1 Tax=Anguilla anguilla TaxID=7936 RepID=A0A9D3S227_ANGAN|nr:hypothetical protein ANANG_G00112150 [Anguilla anguilla]